MKKNMPWKFTDESSVTFQSSVSVPGEFGLGMYVSKPWDMFSPGFKLWVPITAQQNVRVSYGFGDLFDLLF